MIGITNLEYRKMKIPQLGKALFVPVINHVDEKSIKEIANGVRELAQKARTLKVKPEDMAEG
ncbi:2-oxo acid dehydrogenase subunit E2 [Peribacillus sp. NPDC096448]|uniref:2-oxo acid dehydrogenase subunit E2 n=1 Tax=Peribacillus sp. NPDC096448 TaxID=3364395 RepID=UPI003819A4C1